MKNIFILLLFVLIPGAYSQVITDPQFAVKSHETLDILRIVNDSEQLVIQMIIKNELDEGGSFCVDGNTIISSGGKKYKIKKIKGIPECPDVHTFGFTGDNLQFNLYFPPLPEGTVTMDITENCDLNCFSFRGVVVDPVLDEKMKAAFDYYESGMLPEALASYKELISEYSGLVPDIEALLYFYTIIILDETGNKKEAKLWLQKLKEQYLPGSEWVFEKLAVLGY